MKQHLDAGGRPLDEVGQVVLPDVAQALVHLGGVHLALHRMPQPLPASATPAHTGLHKNDHSRPRSLDDTMMQMRMTLNLMTLTFVLCLSTSASSASAPPLEQGFDCGARPGKYCRVF